MRPMPDWSAGVHHDGSELYVSNPLPTYGEVVTLHLRVPLTAPVRRVFLRTVPDGEDLYVEIKPSHSDARSVWWTGTIAITMPVNPYSFKLFTENAAYYVTGTGFSQHEPTIYASFKLLADYDAPTWVNDSVFYHIFVDRFHNGDPSTDVLPGAWSRDGFTTQRRAWGAPPLPFRQAGSLDFYGGDLPGIAQKLDYLTDLGVNTVCLTPIFTARTNHRYDTIDFNNVDPHVGGNAGLAALREALDSAHMHIALDMVVNHLGDSHPWFTAAQQDITAPTADYFTFHNHPHDYQNWLGHTSLVKFNYRNATLRDAMYRAPDSILRRWLRPPYRIDSWRFDVFHMMARQNDIRLEGEISREIRQILKRDNPKLYIYGEHSYDGTPHLQGDEVDATMNYGGFSVPLRRWFTESMGSEWESAYNEPAPLPGDAMIAQWKARMGMIPWVIARQQYHMLSSHDMMRFLTVVNGNKAYLRLAAAILLTYPGVPTIYYGDEIGMEGGADPDNRRTFPWDESEWDHDLRSYFQTLIRLRRTAPALLRGGMQFLTAEESLIAYQRHSAEQRLIVVGHRGPGVLLRYILSVWETGIADGAVVIDLLSGGRYSVENGALVLRNLAAGQALVLEAQG